MAEHASQDWLGDTLAEAAAVGAAFARDCRGQVVVTGGLMAERLASGGKVLVCGNGGSAADAQHFVAELVVRFVADRRALPGIALTVDPSIATACGNDYGFERVFARQVEALGRSGDVLVGITTSGGSKNVLAALDVGKRAGLSTVALTGAGPNAAADLADTSVTVPSKVTARVQECHVLTLHLWCGLIERGLGIAG